MLARHITHPMLDGVEYFFVGFRDQKDIDDFCKKCPWFEPEDIEIGNKYVVAYHQEPNEWYEIFPWGYFGRKLNDIISVYNAILMQYSQF